MRKALDLCIHLAHVGLLLTAAALDDWRERRPARDELDRVASDVVFDAYRPLPEPRRLRSMCTMPVWRADPNVHHAMRVARLHDVEDGASPAPDAASCVNPYARLVASP